MEVAPQNIRNSSHLDSKPSNASANELIRFAISQNFLGRMLVASSEKGVCAVLLGDNARALIADLHSRFPKAKLRRGDAELEASVARIALAIETPESTLSVSLDPRGTALQQRIWRALREIPMGSTASYQEIARNLDMSITAQAVAEACAANAIAILVPCHRVVRRDGSLAGYRWGIKRKRALLQKEQEISPEPGSLFHAAALAAHR
jgi:AraC family transcriptional regulator, regulatory protein of adaptative response / methylated-DNA-[protein]-cysteine methyltransferase